MNKDWLPNWEDAASYPDLSVMNPTQRAWEFLRRNPDYYESYVSLYPIEDGQDTVNETLNEIEVFTSNGETPPDGYEKLVHRMPPPTQDSELISTWRKRVGESGIVISRREYLVEQYGFAAYPSFLPAPWRAIPATSVLHFDSARRPVVFPSTDSHLIPEYLEDRSNHVAIVFDLSLSIPGQLKFAKQSLLRRQSSSSRSLEQQITRQQSDEILTRYLRIIDAQTKGEKPTAVLKVLFPEQEKSINVYKSNLAQALALRDGGYIKLLPPRS